MKKSHADNLIKYLKYHTSITMSVAIDKLNCWCLSQTVTAANKKLAGTGMCIINIKQDGRYAIYAMGRIW